MKLGIHKIALLAALILLGAFALTQQAAAGKQTYGPKSSITIQSTGDYNGGCICDCLRSPGYWMNHPCEFEWCIFDIELCKIGVPINRCIAIDIMKEPVKGNKMLTLFPAWAAAFLNAVRCGDNGEIWDLLVYTLYEWILDCDKKDGVRANSDEWQCEGKYILLLLEGYNDGLFCPVCPD